LIKAARIRRELNLSQTTYRPHIAVVGKRNVGKSRFVNTLIGREVSAVSEIAGTTIDPIKNPLELLPYGPVLIVDTAGIDDEGELGSGRITQTIKTIASADLVILIIDSRTRLSSKERELIAYLDKIEVTYLLVVNKIEFGVNEKLLEELKELRSTHFEVSCKEEVGFEELKRKIIRMLPREDEFFSLKDIIAPADKVLMVLPSGLPDEEHSLLLSYLDIIKNNLDENTIITICKDTEFSETLAKLNNTQDIIITESHLVNKVSALVPEKVKFTTFSLLINRMKSDIPVFVKGLQTVSKLKAGDKILFAEGCSQHPYNNCKFKIKEWLYSNSKKELNFDFIFDEDLPENLSEYKLLVHCDGCKLNHTEMQTRINEAKLMDVPIVTYGIVASYMKGAIPREVAPLGIKSV
jgi:[FeFe] hydrogenase H-cluster maturation GTPase HydF